MARCIQLTPLPSKRLKFFTEVEISAVYRRQIAVYYYRLGDSAAAVVSAARTHLVGARASRQMSHRATPPRRLAANDRTNDISVTSPHRQPCQSMERASQRQRSVPVDHPPSAAPEINPSRFFHSRHQSRRRTILVRVFMCATSYVARY